MKTLLSLVVTSVLLMGATTVNAADVDQSMKETLTTKDATSFAEAYQLGVEKLSILKSIPPEQLTNQVHGYSSSINKRTARVEDSSYVTVQERMYADGILCYVGLVSVEVSYQEHDKRIFITENP
ncbi:DUF3316 domain-containing protein [Leucothrix arctica]|uniref:DUF3887 domain-containing protein n=1 Tax=Leucothrix arctica TaxID=1481894 RepID=A0A317C3B1_9GAMM|nr:DUF3316 domain-containing protein [Leucothrix arctica]PWQ93135.1 hypothetical protein DKT75_20820 [Leucothrix arctica]